MITDVWMQHPTVAFSEHEMFESLRRWTGQEPLREEMPIAATVAAMGHAGVELGLPTAWHAPREGAVISNQAVAGWLEEHPDRFAGVCAVDLATDDRRRPRRVPVDRGDDQPLSQARERLHRHLRLHEQEAAGRAGGLHAIEGRAAQGPDSFAGLAHFQPGIWEDQDCVSKLTSPDDLDPERRHTRR